MTVSTKRKRPECRRIHRSPAKEPCSVHGCPNTTTERKPYCIEHLYLIPETEAIAAELRRREFEVALAARGNWRRIDSGGTVANELRSLLRVEGALNLQGIASKLSLDITDPKQKRLAAESYCLAIGAKINIVRNRRGRKAVVSLEGEVRS